MASRSDKTRHSIPGPGPRKGAPQGPAGRRYPGRAAFAVAGLGLLALLAYASVFHVGPEGRTVRTSIGGGGAALLSPGWHSAVPFIQRRVHLPPGPIEIEGEVPLPSREGVSLAIPFRVTAEIGDAPLKSLLGSQGLGGDPRTAIRQAGSAAVMEWAAGRSNESIVLAEGGRALEKAIRDRIEKLGFDAVTARLGATRGPAELLATVRSGALRDRVVNTGARVAIFGLDGADWEIIDPLMARGELPTLARLKARGAWGNMKSMNPMLSPLLWTTVATGKPPEEHGIIDFLVQDKKTGQAVPVSSHWRKVKALWNILGDAGRSSAFIAWWGTWPAEVVNGYMVSDRVAYSLFGYKAAEEDRIGATYPPGFFKEIRPRIVDDSSIPLSEVQKFVRVTPEEFHAMRARLKDDPKLGYREPVNHLTKILAGAKTYQAIGLEILARGQPDVFSLYYQGIDEACHRFGQFMPPKMDMVSDADYARYRGAVEAYYRYQDHLLGEMLARLAPDTTILVLSDHGFRSGGARPPNEPSDIEGKPGLWHRRYGILIMAGPTIRPGRLDTTELPDVAPTVLYLVGMPIAEDMLGRIMEEAIAPEFRSRFPVRTVSSYETLGRPLDRENDVVADSDVNQEMLEQLKALGYVAGDAPAGAGEQGGDSRGAGPRQGGEEGARALVTGHINEGALYLKNKDYRRAESAAAEALKIAPDLIPALLLSAQIQVEQKHHAQAIETLERVVSIDPVSERQSYIQLGNMFSEGGRVDEGIDFLRRQAQAHPKIAEIRSAIGSILLSRGDAVAAEKELLEALRLNPALGEPLTGLHKIYGESDRMLTVEPIVRKGLQINDQSVVHHNWMGLIYQWKKQVPQAEQEFHRAMEIDPDDGGTMANLGALYGRTGRLAQAVEILSRAVAKEPENLEAWVNLGASQGRMGHAREAITALETARRKGMKTTTLYNALALAYVQDSQREKALEYLRESLAMDPGQKDARDLLKFLTRPS